MTQNKLISSLPDKFRLERFPAIMNREGFTEGANSDSRVHDGEKASMDGTVFVAGFAGSGYISKPHNFDYIAVHDIQCRFLP